MLRLNDSFWNLVTTENFGNKMVSEIYGPSDENIIEEKVSKC